MAYQTALTIAEVVNDIHRKKYLLPAIQREFVWDINQIESYLDKHFMPKDVSRDFLNFIEFFNSRETLLKDHLKFILNVEELKENIND
tara:strand:+ start:291 stop:554 length:264 start_codon:yes stop_codon:yes gene_type:complete